MADIDGLQTGLLEVKEAVAAQTAGLMQMLGILATQTKMLQQIVGAVTAEPTGESPLVAALGQVLAVAEGHTVVLERIEKALTKARPI